MASLNTCAPPPSIHLVVARPPELPPCGQCARPRLHALVLASISLGTRLVGAACGGGGCAGLLGDKVVSVAIVKSFETHTQSKPVLVLMETQTVSVFLILYIGDTSVTLHQSMQ